MPSPDYDADDEERRLMPPPPEVAVPTPSSATANRRKQLNTPLASMLPEKYANTEITELFPDFREDKVSQLRHCCVESED